MLAQLVDERVEGRNAQRPLPIGKTTGQALSPEAAKSVWTGQLRREVSCAVAKAQARHFLDRVWLVGQPRGAAKRGKPSCGDSPIEQRLRYNDWADRESNRARVGGFGQGDRDA